MTYLGRCEAKPHGVTQCYHYATRELTCDDTAVGGELVRLMLCDTCQTRIIRKRNTPYDRWGSPRRWERGMPPKPSVTPRSR